MFLQSDSRGHLLGHVNAVQHEVDACCALASNVLHDAFIFFAVDPKSWCVPKVNVDFILFKDKAIHARSFRFQTSPLWCLLSTEQAGEDFPCPASPTTTNPSRERPAFLRHSSNKGIYTFSIVSESRKSRRSAISAAYDTMQQGSYDLLIHEQACPCSTVDT